MSTSPAVSGTSCEFEHNCGYFPDDVKTDDEFQPVRGESDYDDEFHYRSLVDYEPIGIHNPFKSYNSRFVTIKEDDSEFQNNMLYKLIYALQNYIARKINGNMYSDKLNETLYYVNSDCSLITFDKDNNIGYFQIDSSINYLNGMIVRYYYINEAFQLVNNDEYYNTCTHIDNDECDICHNIKSIPFAPFAYMPYVSIELEEIKQEDENEDGEDEDDKDGEDEDDKDEEDEDDYSVYELDSVC
jgi:hypothetical protein